MNEQTELRAHALGVVMSTAANGTAASQLVDEARVVEEYLAGAGLIGGTLRSDILYKFAGWLTTRDEVITIGASIEASPMAEAVDEYLKSNP